MIHRNVFHNDAVYPIEKMRWSPGQAGLVCGWGLFTTVRIVRGEAFAYERHWRRLEKDAARTHCPFPFDPEQKCAGSLAGSDSEKRCEGRLCADLCACTHQVGFWRSDEAMPEVDLILYTAPLPAYRGVGAADRAGTWTARRFSAGGSENDFVAEQRVESVRGAARAAMTKWCC